MINKTEQAILFAGLLYSDKTVYQSVKIKLKEKYGNIKLESDEHEWIYSDYYRDEFGWPIIRRFVLIDNIIDPGTISDIKLTSILIEKEYSVYSKRSINIDPGYITLSKVVLPTTKNYSHRIYLKDGIYAEVTLIFKDGSYQPHIFTYPDYKETYTLEFLKKGRDILIKL